MFSGIAGRTYGCSKENDPPIVYLEIRGGLSAKVFPRGIGVRMWRSEEGFKPLDDFSHNGFLSVARNSEVRVFYGDLTQQELSGIQDYLAELRLSIKPESS